MMTHDRPVMKLSRVVGFNFIAEVLDSEVSYAGDVVMSMAVNT